MNTEEVADWLYRGYMKYILGLEFHDQLTYIILPLSLYEETKAKWLRFAEEHKQVFHAGDMGDT
jgi:hypothetical protein